MKYSPSLPVWARGYRELETLRGHPASLVFALPPTYLLFKLAELLWPLMLIIPCPLFLFIYFFYLRTFWILFHLIRWPLQQMANSDLFSFLHQLKYNGTRCLVESHQTFFLLLLRKIKEQHQSSLCEATCRIHFMSGLSYPISSWL